MNKNKTMTKIKEIQWSDYNHHYPCKISSENVIPKALQMKFHQLSTASSIPILLQLYLRQTRLSEKDKMLGEDHPTYLVNSIVDINLSLNRLCNLDGLEMFKNIQAVDVSMNQVN